MRTRLKFYYLERFNQVTQFNSIVLANKKFMCGITHHTAYDKARNMHGTVILIIEATGIWAIDYNACNALALVL